MRLNIILEDIDTLLNWPEGLTNFFLVAAQLNGEVSDLSNAVFDNQVHI